MPETNAIALQITPPNKLAEQNQALTSLAAWMAAYFQYEVTTLPSSQKEQQRDLKLFLEYVIEENGDDRIDGWSPRLTQSFKIHLQAQKKKDGTRRRSDRTVNRILAHLKTFAKWVHKFRAFKLGEPTARLKLLPTASLLDIERAITPVERQRILDAADLLLQTGGLSWDRHRHRGEMEKRPKRKGYQPFRNRAIIYTLIETGMLRVAITRLTVKDVDTKKRALRTEEKGGVEHWYQISQEGLRAILDYLENERALYEKKYKSPTLFLPAVTIRHNSTGKFTPDAVNHIWNQVCTVASVSGKTPHSARHGMGKHIMEKTGNLEAVQR